MKLETLESKIAKVKKDKRSPFQLIQWYYAIRNARLLSEGCNLRDIANMIVDGDLNLKTREDVQSAVTQHLEELEDGEAYDEATDDWVVIGDDREGWIVKQINAFYKSDR